MPCVIWYHFVQFKKRPYRSVTFSEVAPPWVFFTYLKLCKWYQTLEQEQGVKYETLEQGVKYVQS